MQRFQRSNLLLRGCLWAAAWTVVCCAWLLARSISTPTRIDPETRSAQAKGSASARIRPLDGAPGEAARHLIDSTGAPAKGVLFAVRTPLSEEDLARHIAAAWQTVEGKPIARVTLAVLWAHTALETGRGRAMLGHNFAGIKGQALNGGSRLLWTWEGSGKVRQRVRRTFRVYASPAQGAEDYVQLLASRHRRAKRAAERGQPSEFVSALAESGFFTHGTGEYSQAVTSLMLEYLRENPEPAASAGGR